MLRLKKDKKGIAPLMAGVLIAGIIGAVALGYGTVIAINNMTQTPNVTYNVQEPTTGGLFSGISLGGESGDLITWIILGVFALIALMIIMRSPKKPGGTITRIIYGEDRGGGGGSSPRRRRRSSGSSVYPGSNGSGWKRA